jgi:hypothetical protein
MSEGTAKEIWKRALLVFVVYIALVFVVGIVASRINGISWEDIWVAFGSWRLWTLILIPGILVLIANLVPWKIFVPMFVVVFGAFLLISGLPGLENVGKAIKGLGDIELLAFGTTVVAIGLAFMQLYRKRSDMELYGQSSDKDKELKMIIVDLDKMGQTVEKLDASIKGLRDRINDLQSSKDDIAESGE